MGRSRSRRSSRSRSRSRSRIVCGWLVAVHPPWEMQAGPHLMNRQDHWSIHTILPWENSNLIAGHTINRPHQYYYYSCIWSYICSYFCFFFYSYSWIFYVAYVNVGKATKDHNNNQTSTTIHIISLSLLLLLDIYKHYFCSISAVFLAKSFCLALFYRTNFKVYECAYELKHCSPYLNCAPMQKNIQNWKLKTMQYAHQFFIMYDNLHV